MQRANYVRLAFIKKWLELVSDSSTDDDVDVQIEVNVYRNFRSSWWICGDRDYILHTVFVKDKNGRVEA